MAKAPKSVEVRSFQVGFGDCFLVTFVYGASDQRHVLIDFGTTGLRPKKTPKSRDALTPSKRLPEIARAIRDLCKATREDGRLTAVIATHRHADHISGFATDAKSGESGRIIRSLRPKLVMQPWTEDPDAEKEAASATRAGLDFAPRLAHVKALARMGDIAERVHDFALNSRDRTLSAAQRQELALRGMDNIKNQSAVDNLRKMGLAKGAKREFARYGDRTALESLLPGVKVHVLGPPDLTQTLGIKRMTARDPGEFWHLLAATRGKASFQKRRRNSIRSTRVPPNARWFCDRLDRLEGRSLLQVVRQLDRQMNNTSLILLFEAGTKKLLFPGDAQLENWSYALRDAPEADQNIALLRDIDVLKVGHHGSLNATPKTLLWDKLKKRKVSGKKQLITFLSTQRGHHGDARSKTEVPRTTLKQALASETDLQSTEDYKKGLLLRDKAGTPFVLRVRD